jgi:hypothetical protein
MPPCGLTCEALVVLVPAMKIDEETGENPKSKIPAGKVRHGSKPQVTSQELSSAVLG